MPLNGMALRLRGNRQQARDKGSLSNLVFSWQLSLLTLPVLWLCCDCCCCHLAAGL